VWINRKFVDFFETQDAIGEMILTKSLPLNACCLARRCLVIVAPGCDNCCLESLDTVVYLYPIVQSL
jgi:hypothetical protein